MSTIIRGLFALFFSAAGLLGTQRAAVEIVQIKHPEAPARVLIDPPLMETVSSVVPTPIHSYEIKPEESYGDERREPISEFDWSEETTAGVVPEGLTLDPDWDAVMADPARTEPYLPPYRTSAPEWRCDGWVDLARRVGWPEEQLPKMSYVMYRESRCDPKAHNGDDPAGGSSGLMQLNRYFCKRSRYHENGYFVDNGILDECDDLFDPRLNLEAALFLWENSGWGPWGMSN
jgi:hypothetical protein